MDRYPKLSFEDWLLEYRRLAEEQDLHWLAAGAATPEQRRAWENGVDPDDELNALACMAQWRGCGCGGA